MKTRNVLKKETEAARAELIALGINADYLELLTKRNLRIVAYCVKSEKETLQTRSEQKEFKRSAPGLLNDLFDKTEVNSKTGKFQYTSFSLELISMRSACEDLPEEFPDSIRRLACALASCL